MKKLYLLRHADAKVSSGTDATRQLSEAGYKETKVLEEAMTSKGISCDIVLCSVALRAIQTYNEIVSSIVGSPPVEQREDLYCADLNGILKILKKGLNKNYESIFIVTHNPTVSKLATYLTGSGEIHFGTGILKLLEIDVDKWYKIAPACAKLVWSIPK